MSAISDIDRVHLRRCVELARQAVENGDSPYGSLLLSPTGDVLFEDHNHTSTGDMTQHPEFAIARWSAANLSPEDRAACTVYTSGEHCAMCAAAHAFAGLGRIVYASSSEQTRAWYREWGDVANRVIAPLPINAVAPFVDVAGPDVELAEEIRALHAQSIGLSL